MTSRFRISMASMALVALASQTAFAGGIFSKVRDVEPANNVFSTAPVIALGELGRCTSFRANLASGDTDVYRVDLGSNGQVVFITTPLVNVGTLDTNPDTLVRILDVAGVQVGDADDDAGAGLPIGLALGSVARYQLNGPATAVYFEVSPLFADETGSYMVTIAETFGINFDASESASNGTALSADILDLGVAGPLTVRGTLDTAIDNDYFGVDMQVGDILIASTAPQTSTWDTPDTLLDVIDTDGVTTLLTNDDDGCDAIVPAVTSRGSTVRFKSARSARHYVRIRGFQGDVGEYRALFAVVPSASIFCPGDADGNGAVNFADVVRVLAVFNSICQ